MRRKEKTVKAEYTLKDIKEVKYSPFGLKCINYDNKRDDTWEALFRGAVMLVSSVTVIILLGLFPFPSFFQAHHDLLLYLYIAIMLFGAIALFNCLLYLILRHSIKKRK